MDKLSETYLEVEVQHNDHLPITWLEDGVLNIVVKNVYFITTDRRETETCGGTREKPKRCFSRVLFISTGETFHSLTIGMCL